MGDVPEARRCHVTLLEAAKTMAKTFNNRNYTSLEQLCRWAHERHPEHCGGKNDPFDALRACSCSLNQLLSGLRHGQTAIEEALREPT